MRRLLPVLLILAADALAEVRVQALALMEDAAMLRINGQQKFLRVGQTGPYGLKLLSASSSEAEVEVEGRRLTLSLSREVGAGFKPVERLRVQISRDPSGHYITPGRINRQAVRFLVDTGATRVALSEQEAQRLGIRYRELGEKSVATTASGQVRSWIVKLASVRIGDIELNHVSAAVLEGSYPDIPLLGLTVLGRLRLSEHDGMMVLETR